MAILISSIFEKVKIKSDVKELNNLLCHNFSMTKSNLSYNANKIVFCVDVKGAQNFYNLVNSKKINLYFFFKERILNCFGCILNSWETYDTDFLINLNFDCFTETYLEQTKIALIHLKISKS